MSDEAERLGQLAEEFTTRVRQGQLPDIEAYAADHPDLAARIRDLFPALLLLEGLAGGATAPAGSPAPAPGAEPEPGSAFGPYRIVREIGRGGMGIVYEAVHLPLTKRVALKVLPVRGPAAAGRLERFLREARTAAKVKCDFICPIYAVGEDNGIPFIAMQLLKGEPLDAPVKQGVRLPVGDVLRASGSPSGGNGRTRSPTGPSSSVSTRIRSMV
jgi:serine/threonine protein kinase